MCHHSDSEQYLLVQCSQRKLKCRRIFSHYGVIETLAVIYMAYMLSKMLGMLEVIAKDCFWTIKYTNKSLLASIPLVDVLGM